MDIDNEKYIVVGRFGAPFGVKGWMKIHSFTEPNDNILQYQPWYADLKTGLTKIKLADSKKHHKNIVAHVEGCEQKEETALYCNANIVVSRDALPVLNNDEYYCSDLEGLSVFTVDGEPLGKIDYILPTGANDVLVIKGEKEHLVPYLRDQVIKKIDLTDKTMVVNWDPDF